MHPARRTLLQSQQVDLDAILQSEQRIRAAQKAPGTKEAYFYAWRAFTAWCQIAGVQALPAAPRTVQSFATWCLDHGYRIQTVCIRLNGIADYHRESGFCSPVDASVRKHMANAKRHFKETPGGKQALTTELLRKIMGRFPDTLAGTRNRSMVLLGFAAGWRRGEVTRLWFSDIRFVPRGLELFLRYSKTDQMAEGRIVGIQPGENSSTCPLLALRTWIGVRGNWEGPLFPRITPRQEVSREPLCGRAVTMHLALRRALEEVGENPKLFGAHSLRSGMITEAAKNGATESAIMQRTGHKSSAALRRYIRPATAFDFNPLRGIL